QFDFSDGYFIMTLDDSINVVVPSGGESLARGSQFDILWDDNISENVIVELYQNDVYHSDITLSTPSDGSYTWDIAEDIYGSNFQIKLSSVEIPLATFDLSEGYFDIAEGSLNVLTPNGGEDLTRGNQYEITWSDDIPEDVKLELYQNDVYHSDIILSTPSVGSYLWNVPNDLYGSNFQVRAVSITFPAIINDMSDPYFTITPGVIFVTYPNGGEAFDRGDPINISWTDNISENIKIELYKNDIYLMDIVTSTESDGSYVWNIPIDLSGNYKIKITSIDYDIINDLSDNTFEILIGAVSVLTPNGGGILTRDSQFEITWIDNITEEINIELYQNDVYHSDIITSTASDGSYLWNIANDIYGSNFQVKISSITFPLMINDTSDGYFTISEGVITVLTPNGGENIERESQFEITWTNEILEEIKIELYQNDSYHSDIISSVINDSTYTWNIPSELSGSDFQVKISSLALPSVVSDISDSYFTISAGIITILTPTEDENLIRGSQYEITWTDDIPEFIRIEIYENDTYHSTIADSTESNGSYFWTIPFDIYGVFKIKIVSTDNASVYDINDTGFDILTGRVRVLLPSDGEELYQGSQYEITWTDDILEDVKIELYQNDVHYSDIDASTSSDGSYIWNIPTDILGADFQVRISSLIIPDLANDISTGYFTISDATRVITPNGGELLIAGDFYDINWVDILTEDIKIELFQDDIFNSIIAESTPSDSSYSWFIPYGLQGSNYKVKISSITSPATYNDMSDGNFSIISGTIAITAPQSGAVLEMMDDYSIEWTDDIYEDVVISLYKNTSLIAMINTASNGNYIWDFHTNDIVAGTDYNLKIESKVSSAIYDQTGSFTIKGTNNVNGSVFGVWTEPNSPYILIDSTYVISSNSLLIEPRVKVKGAPSHINFDIRGKMESFGEYSSEIRFKNINLSYNNSVHPDTSKVTYTVFDRDYKDNFFSDNK
ncbi:MAG: hypothetical protein GQ534_09895, partial [Candidatus Delongbacteria bacterium]|nr:hypothetical protein [Candidatus Delongbacteria bacterium]